MKIVEEPLRQHALGKSIVRPSAAIQHGRSVFLQHIEIGAHELGCLGELTAAAALLMEGYEPYMPLPGRTAKYDMLGVHSKSGVVVKVSVKANRDGKERSYDATLDAIRAQVHFLPARSSEFFKPKKKKKHKAKWMQTLPIVDKSDDKSRI